MTRKFVTDNNSPLSSIFVERIFYDFFAFSPQGNPTFRDPVGIKNYWNLENLLYGKVDKTLSVIEPINEILVTIPNQGETIYSFPEVAASFLNFQERFRIPAKTGRLAEDGYLQTPILYRGFIDATVNYNQFLTDMISQFNKLLFDTQKESEIRNIKDYSRMFFKHIIENINIPFLTKTSYHLSRENSSLGSALSLEIADLNPASNKDKDEFIKSKNFAFYKQAAINSGFLIDKNIPWRLNFDLSSPANAEKISPGYDSADLAASFLNQNFAKVATQDMDYLISTVVVGYNSLVAKKDFYMDGRCAKARTQVIKEDMLKKTLKMNYWTSKYIKLRNYESGNQYTDSEIEKIIFNANEMARGKIEYIDKKFRMPFIHEGSTVFENIKNYYANGENISLDNFSERVIMIIKKSINEIY